MDIIFKMFKKYPSLFIVNLASIILIILIILTTNEPVILGFDVNVVNTLMSVISNISQGIIVSTFFFYLVSYYPTSKLEEKSNKIAELHMAKIRSMVEKLIKDLHEISIYKTKHMKIDNIKLKDEINLKDLKFIFQFVKGNEIINEFHSLEDVYTQNAATISQSLIYKLDKINNICDEILKLKYIDNNYIEFCTDFRNLELNQCYLNGFLRDFFNRNEPDITLLSEPIYKLYQLIQNY